MRIVAWNVRCATAGSQCWPLLLSIDPDISLLQEVNELSPAVRDRFACLHGVPTKKSGAPQRFKTMVLIKGSVSAVIDLRSETDWINAECQRLGGCILACKVQLRDGGTLYVVSVHSPSWPIARSRLAGIDVAGVKLRNNPDIWGTEILWSTLRRTMQIHPGEWIVGGDFNSSETFDAWKKGGRGNREVIERMNALGLVDCLRAHHGQLVPTFRTPRGGRVEHQMDHLYVSDSLLQRLRECHAAHSDLVFQYGLSDHLPIVADLD